MSTTEIVFYILAALLIFTGAMVAFRSKPIESALWLILNFICTSALYVLLGAHFVAVIQILVYAGAIVVLFTFVILLLNLNPRELGMTAAVPWTSLVLFVGTIAIVLFCMHVATPELAADLPELPHASESFGSLDSFARVFLHKYIWAFEVAGVLLLLAILAVGLLSYRAGQKRSTLQAVDSKTGGAA